MSSGGIWLQNQQEKDSADVSSVGVWLQDRQEKDTADVSVLVFGYRIGRRKTVLMFQCWCSVTGSAGERQC